MRSISDIVSDMDANAAKAKRIREDAASIRKRIEDRGSVRASDHRALEELKAGAENCAAAKNQLDAEMVSLYTSGTLDHMTEGGTDSDRPGDYRPSGRHQRLHSWTEASLDARGGLSLRERGTHSVSAPVVGGILNAWPTDPIRYDDNDTDPHALPRRTRFVADLLAVRPVTEDGVSYVRQVNRTNNAAPVARHGAKPTSLFTLTPIQDRTRTIAHLSEPIAIQDIADNAALDDFIEDELVLGVLLALDAQLISGDGTGENMTGLINTAGILTEAFDTDMARTARKAITTLEETEVAPGAWVLNPGDWETIDLAIATDTHVANSPVDRAARRLWSIPVVLSNAVAPGKAILADWSGARLALREDATIDWQTSGVVDDGGGAFHDLFENNQTRGRAEMRAVLEVVTPSKFIEVNLV